MSVDGPAPTATCKPDTWIQAAHLTKFRRDSSGAPVDQPAPTITANSFEVRPGGAAPIGLAAASMVQTGYGEREGQEPRALDVEAPIGCQVAGGAKHAVVANYIASTGGGEYAGRPRPVEKPLNVVTAENRQTLVAAHMAQHNAGPNNDGLAGRSLDDPLTTLTGAGAQQQLVASHLAHLRGSGERHGNDVDAPAVTLTAGRGHHVAEVRTFLVKYYETAVGQDIGLPLDTVTTKPRFGLVEVATTDIGLTDDQRYTAWWVARMIDVYGHPAGLPKRGARRRPKHAVRHATIADQLARLHVERPSAVGRDGWLVWDIGMRMLTVRERFRANGVGDDFRIDVAVDGKPVTATKQGEMCGNMVCPGVAEAIARAALPELRESEAVAA